MLSRDNAFCAIPGVADRSGGWRQNVTIGAEGWRQNVTIGGESRGRFSKVADIALLYPEAVVASSDSLGWQNVRVIYLRHTNEFVVPPADSHCLLLNVGQTLSLGAQLDNCLFEGDVRPGELAIVPANFSWKCESPGAHMSQVLLMYFQPLFIRSVAHGFCSDIESLAPQIGFCNKQIHHVAMSLLQELNEASIVSRLYADSLAFGLAMQFVRRYSSLQQVRVARGGMAPHKLRKVISIIDHHVAAEHEGRVALKVVAREVGMSYFHFSRVFKRSMGISPTSYIVARRIELAKELLNQTELPISEIALRSGFSSQSHFTTSFRRLAGHTPKDFRATA